MRPHSRTAAALVFTPVLLLCAAVAGAQPAYRVKDIDTASTPGVDLVGAFGGLDSTVLFGASSLNNPGQLWRSDGTPGGTVLVKSIQAGTPTQFARLGADLLFISGTDLWKTDGTDAGTTRVKGFAYLPAQPSLMELTVVDGALYFTAHDGVHGYELWRSDGTEEGTIMVADLLPGADGSAPYSLTRAGDLLYFFAWDGVAVSLWKSDGTEAGSIPIAALGSGRTPSSLTVADSGLLFFLTQQSSNGVVTYSLWRSDGTEAGTALVRDFAADYPSVCPGSCFPYGPSNLTPLRANTVLLIANDGVSGRQLWSSDGTAAGTAPVVPGSGPVLPGTLTRFHDLVYFDAFDAAHGDQLWRTDGTGPGTALFKDTAPGALYGNPYAMTVFRDRLYFATPDFLFGKLWISDGTEAGTLPLKDVAVATSGFGYFTATDTELFFLGSAPNAGGLWKTDGTEGGTALVSDFLTAASSFPFYLTDVGGRLFFSVRRGESPEEGYLNLWTSDGTEEGTVPIASFFRFAPGTLDPAPETAVMGNRFFFDADDGVHGVELWSSDGTAAGTAMVRDIAISPFNSDAYPGGLTPVGSTLFFAALDATHGFELWKSDGSDAGTVLVKDINPGETGSTDGNTFFASGGLLFFTADDGVHGGELWRSDGTEAGTFLVKDISPGIGYAAIYRLVSLGGFVLFIASDETGFGLWSSDGTEAGTRMIVAVGPSANGSSLTSTDDLVYFTDNQVGQLFRSDGTAAGTFALKTAGASNLTAVGGRLFFTADDGVHGSELWTTDGSAAGTALVADINPGASGSAPTALAAIDGVLLFAADDGIHGRELWRSDGRLLGTVMIQDIGPGSFSSSPSGFTKSGDLVYFSADDGVTGSELWAIPAAALHGVSRVIAPVSNGPRPTRSLSTRD